MNYSFIHLFLVAKVPWGVWAAAPLVFQLIFKKYGGYYYRSMVAIIAVLVSCTHGLILAMVLPFIGKGNQIAMLSGRVCSFLIKHFLGVVPVIEGSHHFNNLGPSVIVCNHQSVLDILLMGSVCSPGTVCVTKKSLKYYPIFGWFCKYRESGVDDHKGRKWKINHRVI
jgi:lysophosphatidate acyltransferase